LNYDAENPKLVVLPQVRRQPPLRRIRVDLFLLSMQNLREVVEGPGIAGCGR
jgi:hypothetical protein